MRELNFKLGSRNSLEIQRRRATPGKTPRLILPHVLYQDIGCETPSPDVTRAYILQPCEEL
jgi:hypothetical protein